VADVPERTLVLVKPDGVRRGLVGEVLSRIERKGLQLLAVELRTLDVATAEEHYAEHLGKPFFASLIDFITSGPLLAAVAAGPRAIETWRAMMGPTDPVKAPGGTIRGDFGLIVTENLVHGSDSADSAAREVALFFPNLAPR
jgi:nucleoside-diphosphate kinase